MSIRCYCCCFYHTQHMDKILKRPCASFSNALRFLCRLCASWIRRAGICGIQDWCLGEFAKHGPTWTVLKIRLTSVGAFQSQGGGPKGQGLCEENDFRHSSAGVTRGQEESGCHKVILLRASGNIDLISLCVKVVGGLERIYLNLLYFSIRRIWLRALPHGYTSRECFQTAL